MVARFNAYLGLNPEVKFLQISDLFSQITQWTVTDSESCEFTTRKVRHKTLVRWNQLVFKGLVDCFFSRVWSRELRHSHNHRSHWGTNEHRELEIRRLLSRDDSCLIRSIRISEQLFPNKKILIKRWFRNCIYTQNTHKIQTFKIKINVNYVIDS